MQTNNSKDNLINTTTNMITKIINHKHTKSITALALIIGLIGYASDFKKSEAFEYSTYMYNVNIESSNVDNKTRAVSGDTVKLSFEVYDAQVLSNLTASINGKPVTVTCELMTEVMTMGSVFIEKAYAQFYNPASCVAELVITQADIDTVPFLISTLPFEIKFTQLVADGELFISSNFIATNTDDNSYVNVTRNGKASDFTSNIHIESTTPSDITLASADNKVTVSYYINDYGQISNHKANILEKSATIKCIPAKEGIPAQALEFATVTEAQSSIKFPRVIVTDPLAPVTPTPDPVSVPATEIPVQVKFIPSSELLPISDQVNSEFIPAQVKKQLAPSLEKVQQIIDNSPATFLESIVVKAYAKEDIVKGQEGSNFSGPAFCEASIDTSSAELENATYSIVPFVITATFTSRVNKTDIKIENVTDKSFVRIQKNVVSNPEPVVSGGILAVGLISPTPATLIPQDQNTNSVPNNIKQDVADNLDANGKCIPIKGFYKLGDRNTEIKEIKKSINKRMGTNLPITDKFDKELFASLKDWQEKYRDTVLDPWEMESPSGYFYKTSNWSMNYQNGCAVPKFVLEKYKNR